MESMNKKVFVAMSGGVDSSVAAALLKKQGYNVIGVFFKSWQPKNNLAFCNWKEDRKDFKNNPEMKAKEITDKVIEGIATGFYDFILLNYANADVLAHSGDYNGAVTAIEKIDHQLSRLYKEIMDRDGTLVITADHGNVESLTYSGTGEKESRHNLNPVPFILVNKKLERPRVFKGHIQGIIADVAPTILEFMNIEKPSEMTGQSLLSDILQF